MTRVWLAISCIILVLPLGMFAKLWYGDYKCEQYWTPELKVEQLRAAFLKDLSDRAITDPSPSISDHDINEMFDRQNDCAKKNDFEACLSRDLTATWPWATSSGMRYNWSLRPTGGDSILLYISTLSLSGVDRVRAFVPPGCRFHDKAVRSLGI